MERESSSLNKDQWVKALNFKESLMGKNSKNKNEFVAYLISFSM